MPHRLTGPAKRRCRRSPQDNLAAEAGMSRSYLAQVETGRNHLSQKIIAKLADALDAEPAEFFRRPARQDRPADDGPDRGQASGASRLQRRRWSAWMRYQMTS
jgi:transcriptional regulator with XRE-family HTH domain